MILCLVLNILVLKTTDAIKVEDSFEEDPGDKFFRYAAYIPTLATTFQAHFPVFFVEDKSEIPSKRFGFNVIYGIPRNYEGVHPLSADFRNNFNNKLPEHEISLNKGSYPSNKNYANDFSIESTGFVDNRRAQKSQSTPMNDDWSHEEEKSHYRKDYSPPSTTNAYKKFYKPGKPLPASHVSNYRPFPQNTGNLKKSRTHSIYGSPQRKPSFIQQPHGPVLKSSRPTGKLHHREAINSHPRRQIFTSRAPFRPSPPDVFLNSRQSHTDFSTDYSHSVPNYSELGNFTDGIKVFTCVRTNKSETQNEHPQKNKNCYTCVDNKTGSRYEQCSFEDTPLKYYLHHYEQAPVPTRDFRKKRELIFTKSKKEQTRYKRQSEYNPSNNDQPYNSYNHNYRFGPQHFIDDEGIGGNEETSFETDDPNEKCWKSRKGEMLCIACENSDNGGTYEQCSYASDPNNSSYEQLGSREHAEADGRPQYPESISDQPTPAVPLPPLQSYQNDRSHLSYADRLPNNHHVQQNSGYYKPDAPLPTPQYTQSYRPPPPPLPVPPVYSVPANTYFHHDPEFNDNIGRYRFGGHSNYRSPYINFDDTFSNIFPEIANNPEPLSGFDDESDDDGNFSVSLDDEEGQFSMNNKHKIPRNTEPDYLDKINRKDGFKRAMYGMSHKNRTGCKKLIKQKMTCYQCIDEKGTKREDCVYLRPKPIKNNKVYRNYSEFNPTPSNNQIHITKKIANKPEARLVTPRGRYIPSQVINYRSKFPYHAVIRPKVYNSGIEGIRYARSSDNKANVGDLNKGISLNNSSEMPDQLFKESSVRKNDSNEASDKSSEKEIKRDIKITKTEEKYNSVSLEPTELNQNMEGKFSKDTELMFDPVLGISLPKYMLEKSEHEAIFDEILASG